jgi:hypothetical protein
LHGRGGVVGQHSSEQRRIGVAAGGCDRLTQRFERGIDRTAFEQQQTNAKVVAREHLIVVGIDYSFQLIERGGRTLDEVSDR